MNKLWKVMLLNSLKRPTNRVIHSIKSFSSFIVIRSIRRSMSFNSSMYHFSAMFRKQIYKLFFINWLLLIIVTVLIDWLYQKALRQPDWLIFWTFEGCSRNFDWLSTESIVENTNSNQKASFLFINKPRFLYLAS